MKRCDNVTFKVNDEAMFRIVPPQREKGDQYGCYYETHSVEK